MGTGSSGLQLQWVHPWDNFTRDRSFFGTFCEIGRIHTKYTTFSLLFLCDGLPYEEEGDGEAAKPYLSR